MKRKPKIVEWIAPGSRQDPEDRARAEANWRKFSARIDAEEKGKATR